MKSLKRLFFAGSILFTIATACHNKDNNNTNANTTDTTVSTQTAPVQISSDDSLQNGMKDALKDYPTVNGTVNNGEITLTGDINRDRLTPLMQSLNSLHPKKINNNLNIK
jgi:osmotically-inducible protein OsmY